MDVPLRILLLVILTFINAFFASAEIALIQINEAKFKKMAESGDKKAKKVLKLVDNTGKLLSNIQVGVTLSGFLSSAFAADFFADMITDALIVALPSLVKYEELILAVSVVLITIVLSYFTLVFGELVPKRVAMKKGEKLARFAAGPLSVTGTFFAPFIKLLTWSVNGVLRIMGINPNEEDEDVTEEEIILMVNEGQEQGVIGDEESEMINNVLEFNDTTAGDVMVHRTEIAALPVTASYDELIDLAAHERYSRIPVYDGKIDNIIGIVHIKSLIGLEKDDFKGLENMLLTIPFVAESQTIDDVFNYLKKNKSHMAVVLDEFGGTAGLLTMEDILEELVGNILDEYDATEEQIFDLVEKQEENVYVIDGLAEIDDVNDELDIELPTEDYNTVSGFVISMLGEIPEENTHPEFVYENIKFTVLESTKKIITSVKLEITEPEKDGEDSEDDE
jgi:putative hemolysin